VAVTLLIAPTAVYKRVTAQTTSATPTPQHTVTHIVISDVIDDVIEGVAAAVDEPGHINGASYCHAVVAVVLVQRSV
jgi:hypothetical protein